MKQRSVMIQGTASSVGKSLLAAAFCRIFTQDGYNVNPFKSQNMSLNSFITMDGGEMGRAQVMQAECARKPPSVRMNPVLLKPSGDKGCQVIFSGRVVAQLSSMEYYSYKDRLAEGVRSAYKSLLADSDIVVLEGAGSPAEINLKRNDFVNMGMARIADAPVILVGDIDRGGVFASLYGTMMLLEPEERARVKGIIINKFRGDIEILRPGLAQLTDLTGVPVLGVVPYIELRLEEEDSAVPFTRVSPKLGDLRIGVICIPYISNLTDINALSLEPEAAVAYIGLDEDPGGYDLLILPGTKNTMEAMERIVRSGMDKKIRMARDAGAFVFGICGGYQMLGRSISDPDRVESDRTYCAGLDLLGVQTAFEAEKTTAPATGCELLFGTAISGYEIHMGVTQSDPGVPSFIDTVTGRDGAVSHDGRVIGTYFHGIFDNGVFTRRFLNRIRQAVGKPAYESSPVDYAAFKEAQYDRLAQAVRGSVDMEAIYRIVGGGA